MFTLVVYTDWLVQTLVRKGLGLIVLHLQGDAWKWEWLHFFICSIFIEKLTRTQGISSLVPVLPIPAPWTFYKSGSSVCAKGSSLKWAVLGGDFSHRGHVWHLVERKPISPFTCSTLGEVNGLIQFLNFGRSTALVHLGFILLSWERTFLQMTCLLGFHAKYCGETPPLGWACCADRLMLPELSPWAEVNGLLHHCSESVENCWAVVLWRKATSQFGKIPEHLNIPPVVVLASGTNSYEAAKNIPKAPWENLLSLCSSAV